MNFHTFAFFLFFALASIAMIAPLVFGVIACLKARHGQSPPFWLRVTVTCSAIASSIVLLSVQTLPILIYAIISAGTIFCGLLAASFLIRSFTQVSFSKCFLLCGLAIIPCLIWIDLRFRVIVQDPAGEPVDVRKGDIALHHPPESYFQSYLTCYGWRAKKGTTYFRFLRWLQFKEKWTFSGGLSNAEGKSLGDLNWKPARWSEWPKVVITR